MLHQGIPAMSTSRRPSGIIFQVQYSFDQFFFISLLLIFSCVYVYMCVCVCVHFDVVCLVCLTFHTVYIVFYCAASWRNKEWLMIDNIVNCGLSSSHWGQDLHALPPLPCTRPCWGAHLFQVIRACLLMPVGLSSPSLIISSVSPATTVDDFVHHHHRRYWSD